MAWHNLTDKERLELSWDALVVTMAALVGVFILLMLALNANGGVADCLLALAPELSTPGHPFISEVQA